MKCLRNEDEANDIVQECYLKLWQHKEKVNPDKVKYWLFSTAHNTMVNYIKKSSRTVSMGEETYVEPFINQNQDYALKEIIDKALELLPQIQKTIILLRDLEGYNYDEIGEMLQLNESQVKVYLFRARQKMKNSLKELYRYYESN